MNYLFIDFNGKVCMKQERRLHVYYMNNIMTHDSASLHHYIPNMSHKKKKLSQLITFIDKSLDAKYTPIFMKTRTCKVF